MRLIDADKLKEYIKNFDIGNGIGHGQSYILDAINEQPTVYDVDKIVEQLEEEKHVVSLQDEELKIRVAALDDAIEIVKQGGVETETETIRDKAVKWNNNSSKRVPYEFIDYVEGKREICVSDDVCEWKLEDDNLMTDCGDYFNLYDNCTDKFKYCPTCGKKIKVVE